MTTFRQAARGAVTAPGHASRFLTRPCPKCHGRGKIPNLLLPGRHVCRRCDGTGQVPTWAARLLARATGPHDAGPDEDTEQDTDIPEIIRRLLRRLSGQPGDY